jgi:hypothetical protein
MNIVLGERAIRALLYLTPVVRKAFHKQLALREQNLRHPSLQAKKYDESSDLWQGRVNRSWRFYFLIRGDTYFITDVVPHPK